MVSSLWLKKFIEIYSELRTDNLQTLESIYHPDVVFIDPLHRVEGFASLLASFKNSYTNILQCTFVIDHVFESGDEASVYWSMTFSHEKLNGKKPITVVGHSHLKARHDLVIFHRDYLDVGAMIYEHVPLLGVVIKSIKTKAGK
ncbi:nuclear transport factor 2 family protein [Vibrio sp. Of7-15]|uniref:nuclear transport factor 2 family protein n=1 Tax=Vibrio sp. Of7-15 TaxID=2724879 RepID=UPI001EF1EC7C|nr:nuclear transport factor 2 family protein [Vibrio sp. Of7-15]MCG7497871.1 nuclear transport factor 2 family protein [Vibrio sp. Of7-15]